MPIVSVIMPAFNDAEYIGSAIDSVIAQTFTDWELIIIDDGSADDTARIAEKYAKADNRIRVIRQENQGVIAARNNAIAVARGEFILPLDADDIILPPCIQKMHGVITSSDYAVVAPGVERFGRYCEVQRYPGPTPYNMSCGSKIVNCALFRKSDWEKYGGYDPDFKIGCEDYAFWLNFIQDGKKIYRLDDILFMYRIKPEIKSRHSGAIKRNKEIMRLIYKKFPIVRKYARIRKFINFFFQIRQKKKIYIIRILRIPVFVWPRVNLGTKI